MTRVTSLARGEALLLWRSPLALLNAIAVPVAVAVLVRSSMPAGAAGDSGPGASFVTALTAFALISAVYYNLVTALVARREELVLKRLRTGETSDGEILIAAAAPAVAIAWGQILIAVVAAVTGFGMPMPVNPGLVLIAVLLGTAVFTLLAIVSTALTRSVELAQITTMPGILIPLLFSGLMFPLDAFPEPLQRLAQVMPLTPVVDLLRLGLTGSTPDGTRLELAASFGPAVLPVLVLAIWVLLGAWGARRWFRWEPRR